jgi:tRNA/rRNA methyltransferase
MPEFLRGICLVLVRTQGPVNLGMVARLCGNFGITDLRIVQPMFEVDCDEARKFSTHARPLLLSAPVYDSLPAAVADCGLVVGTSARVRDGMIGEPLLPEGLPEVFAERPASRWALVFGNEADGLRDDELRCCQAFVRLRHFGDIYSYNLAHAVGIMLYTLAGLEALPVPRERKEAVPREELDRFSQYWMNTLDRFGFFRRTTAEHFAPKLQRLLGRLHLTQWDVQVLWGMLSQFHYKTFGDRGGKIGAGISDGPSELPDDADEPGA